MKHGTEVTMQVIIPDPRRMRYETFERNWNTPRPTYNKQGRVLWVDWKTKTATVKWADGTTSKTNIMNLKERKIC